MKDSGKRYKMIWRDCETPKVRFGHSYEINTDTEPYTIVFHGDDGDYLVSGTHLIAIEPVANAR